MALNYQALVSRKFPPIEHTYSDRDTILYALSLGLGADRARGDELAYVYEDTLVAFPTMTAIMGTPGPWYKDPVLEIGWQYVVHAEQGLMVFKEIPASATVICTTSLDSVVDKGPGRGAIVHMKRSIHQKATGDLLAELRIGSFLRKDGGYGGPSGVPSKLPPLPTRHHDHEIVTTTSDQAALLYRLNGDMNPLHVDPNAASKAGFSRPILHGLCTYGIVAVAVMRSIGCNASAIRSFSARFTAPVYPGETIKTETWKLGEKSFGFRALSMQQALVVLDNGQLTLQ